jgi:putative DNA primase/helicase
MMGVKDELRKAGMTVADHEYVVSDETVKPSQTLIALLKDLGYTFRVNLCDDTIEVNGRALSDLLAATIRTDLRDRGVKQLKAAEDAYAAEAQRNAYHPVKDYLNDLVWDGKDHIAAFAHCLHSDDPPVQYKDGTLMPLPAMYLYRWMLGAVAKVIDGKQNPMMVWDGAQGIGKSLLAQWLCSGIPHYFIEGPINVQDKDSDVRLMSRFIWEVSELDATTRKADQSALKAFITKREVTVRKAYGRYDITKPALASLIGTVNNSSGFLADETGNRRFYITRLTKIDWSYRDLDVNQVWANAIALYREGEAWKIEDEEKEAQRQINEKYEVDTVLDDYIDKHFRITGSPDDMMSAGDILSYLAGKDIRLSGSERAQAMELARVLTRKGCTRVHTREGKRWQGIIERVTT